MESGEFNMASDTWEYTMFNPGTGDSGHETKESAPGAETKESAPAAETKELAPGIESEESSPGLETEEYTPGLETKDPTLSDGTEEYTPGAEPDEYTPGLEAMDSTPGDDTMDYTPGLETMELTPASETKGATPGELVPEAEPEEIPDRYIEPFRYGWTRQVIKRTGSKVKADVYYRSPQGKKFRSMPEISEYLEANPMSGLETDNFTLRKEQIYKEPEETVQMARKWTKRKSEQTSEDVEQEESFTMIRKQTETEPEEMTPKKKKVPTATLR